MTHMLVLPLCHRALLETYQWATLTYLIPSAHTGVYFNSTPSCCHKIKKQIWIHPPLQIVPDTFPPVCAVLRATQRLCWFWSFYGIWWQWKNRCPPHPLKTFPLMWNLLHTTSYHTKTDGAAASGLHTQEVMWSFLLTYKCCCKLTTWTPQSVLHVQLQSQGNHCFYMAGHWEQREIFSVIHFLSSFLYHLLKADSVLL